MIRLDFAISGIQASPVLLALIGFVVGVLGGFFGVGGGFLAGPLMFAMGVPGNFVVGTDLAHLVGKSIVAAKKHGALGNVDVKLGLLMLAGTMTGVELGAQVIERLKAAGKTDVVLGWIYVAFLGGIGSFMLFESLSTRRHRKTGTKGLQRQPIAYKIQRLNIPPMVSLDASGIRAISIWPIVFVGLLTGLLAGMLGVGGGFIRMPALIYVLGVRTHVAIGTDLFEIIFSAGYGTLSHGIKGNVDIVIALVMHTGAAIGAQIGALSTKFVKGRTIRLGFSLLPFMGSAIVLYRLLTGSPLH